MTKKILFLLHGLCASSDVWQPLIQNQFIKERFDVCLLEFPLDYEKYSFEILVNHFKEQMEYYGHCEGILCGHSLGAHLAIRIGDLIPSLNLTLIQCSPAQNLQDLFSYFKACAALEYLYQEDWNVLEQEIIESHLFSSFESGNFRLQNQSWRDLRRDLAIDLNHGDFPNEIDLLNRRSAKTTLILSSNDALLNTDKISQKINSLVPKLHLVLTHGRDHYAFYDSTDVWFESDVQKCFEV
jgi:pimeloyl-ACP methyl ester carboxylesterase